MSYASVTSSNIPLQASLPQPDRALLNTSPPRASNVADDAAKVNVVSEDFKENPRTITSEANALSSESDKNRHGSKSKKNKFFSSSDNTHTSRLEGSKTPDEGDENPPSPGNPGNRNRRLKEAKADGVYLWETITRRLFQPEMIEGCIGLVNLGLLAGLSKVFYVNPRLRTDAVFILKTAAAATGLLLVEGYATERHRKTPRKSKERQGVSRGGGLTHEMQEVVFRPGVLGGLVGLFNTGTLGALGYLAYANWDRPRWSKSFLSSVAVGLIALVSGEGWLAERHRA